MATENTSPRRSGADWFGLAAFAVLLISSAVLVIRLISMRKRRRFWHLRS